MNPDLALTAERIRYFTERGLWRNETLDGYLDRWATQRPDKLCMVDRFSRRTWAEVSGMSR